MSGQLPTAHDQAIELQILIDIIGIVASDSCEASEATRLASVSYLHDRAKTVSAALLEKFS